MALHPIRLLDFSVYGTEPGPGSVRINDEVQAEIIAEEDQRSASSHWS